MAFISAPASSSIPVFGGFSFARIRAALGRAFTRSQIARMQSVLSMMTNEQLREIGITRGEIADYAEMIVLPSARK